MPTYVALLRGINLGRRRVKMEELRGHFEALKFQRVVTFIASGNVRFDSAVRDTTTLETRIESHLAEALGYEVETFVRTAAEMTVLAHSRPFSAADMDAEANTIHVGFLKEKLPAPIARQLTGFKTDYDLFHAAGREFFWLCRGRMSDSDVWTRPEVRGLKLPSSTMRNLSTVRKLSALAGAAD